MSDPFAAHRLEGRALVATGSTQGLGAAIAGERAQHRLDRHRGRARRPDRGGEADDRLAAADAGAPLGRLLRPSEDIAPMVGHLLSDAAAMVTRSVIDFDQTVLGIPA